MLFVPIKDRHAGATGMVLYDTACRAVAEAMSVDEVKGIRDQAAAMAGVRTPSWQQGA